MFGVKPRNAFISICFAMVGVDQEVDQREIDKMYEVLQRYGFLSNEVEKEMKSLFKMSSSISKVMRYVGKCMASITKLDETMANNLIQALTDIAKSDDFFHDKEKDYLESVKLLLGKS